MERLPGRRKREEMAPDAGPLPLAAAVEGRGGSGYGGGRRTWTGAAGC